MLKIDCGQGKAVFIEAVPIGLTGKAVPASAGQPVAMQEAVDKLKDALRIVADSGEALFETVRKLRIDQAALKMGIGFTAEGNVFIGKVGTAVNFEVTLTCKMPSSQTES